MDSNSLQDLVELISSIIGIITFIAAVAIFILRRMQVRSRLTQVIFLGGFLATSAVLTGIVVAFLPAFARVSSQVTFTNISVSNAAVGNGVAVLGLVLGLVSWLLALAAAFRTRHWVILVAMVIVGALIYTGAVFYNDFSSYLLVGTIPSLFGLFGPEKPVS